MLSLWLLLRYCSIDYFCLDGGYLMGIGLAESDDGSNVLVYNRWGRVGKKGQDKLQGHPSRECHQGV